MRFPTRVAIVIALALIPIVIRFWQSYRATHRPVAEQMRQFAENALRDAATKGVQLDYSTDSIQQVETILGSLHERYLADPSSVNADFEAMSYGAYIGEAIRRNDPLCKGEPTCRWERDHKVGGPESYPLHWRGGESFPTAWCYRRIVNGDEDNVWVKYTLLRDRPAVEYFSPK